MSYHRHVLAGCTPEPLAHYLKALGILRLVSEQKDETCRGAWQDDRFALVTTLSREELEKFFLEEYQPTPLLSPWNGASGFFRTWDGKAKKLRNSKNGEALDVLVSRQGDRWKTWGAAYEHALDLVSRIATVVDVANLAAKERTRLLIVPKGADGIFLVIDKDEGKEHIQRQMVASNGGNPFYASAIVDLGDEVKYPSLWGSGGNDGAIDFTARFMESLVEVFPTGESGNARLLSTALAADTSTGMLTGASGKVGQYLPSAAGGTNATTGFGGQNDTHLNPWDFVFLMEGAVLFASGATKRMNPAAQAQASAPFSLRSHSAGGGTISESEESARGEQWMPLWDRYLTLPELKNFLAEGRAQIGKVSASRPVDMARAISRLGVARGITAFQRYGYLERNGQANFAVPLGRIAVTARPRVRLVDELASWLDRLHRLARAKGAPTRLAHAERELSDAVFAALTHDDSPVHWQAILRAAVRVEGLQSTGTGIAAGPIPNLSVEWLTACSDGSPEFRLATALGSAAGSYSRDNGKPFNSLRHHWLPLEAGSRRFRTSDKKLAHDVRVVAHGRDPEADLLAIIERRTIESAQKEDRHPRIQAAFGAGACLADLTAWIAGELDTVKCVDLARAFMAVDWSRWDPRTLNLTRHENGNHPEEAWGALRLNALPWPLDKERDIPFDPAIVHRLGAGDLAGAVRLALLRLAAHGIQSTIRFGLGDAAVARRWGSALAFPISRHTAFRLLYQLQPQSKETHHDR